jgi:ribosome-associated heat shock protein Hsp15
MTGTSIDKWGRALLQDYLAARARELGRVEAGHQPAPSREVRVADFLQIRTEGGDFEVEVQLLSDVRGPAAIAQTLYRETDESREARRKVAEEKRALMYFTPAPTGRPSKRDRRRIHKFRGEI